MASSSTQKPGGGGSATTDASELTSGELDDARLSSNVPLIDAANSFSAIQTISVGTAGTVQLLDLVGSGADYCNLRIGRSSTRYVAWFWENAANKASISTYNASFPFKFAASSLEFEVSSANQMVIGNGTITILTSTDFVFGTSGDGTKHGTAANQKQAWWGATPVIQPAGANQASIDNWSNIGDVDPGSDTIDLASLNSRIADLNTQMAAAIILLKEIRRVKVEIGTMKGSA